VKDLFKILPKLFRLFFFLVFALLLDFLLFNFVSVCPSCSTFSQFLQTPSSLSGPLIAAIASLLTIKAKKA